MVLTLVTFLIASHVYIRFITPAIPLLSLVFFDNFGSESRSCGGVKINVRDIPVFVLLLGLTAIGLFLNFYFIRTMVDIKEFISDIFIFNFFVR